MRFFKIVLILLITFSASAQKVKIKKGFAYVDKVKFLKVEKINSGKHFLSTLDGTEFLSVKYESFGTGKYHANRNAVTGQRMEIMHGYSVLKFLDVEGMEDAFEVDEGRLKHIVLMLYNSDIIIDGELSIEKIKRMKEKYADNVSERKFLTGN